MNLTQATSVTINNKTVERILINGKTVYNTIQMLLTTNKEHIKTDESTIVNIESNIKNKTIELWKVINMTRTSMGTQTTGSDGKASWTYTGAGAGEVQFIATYDDIESNTVTIEDYTPVIMRAVLTADKTTIISGESVTLTCNYFDQYNELTADYYSSALYDGSTSVEMGEWECPDVFTVSGLSVGTHSFKVVVTNQDSSVLDSNVVSVVVENSFDGMSLGLSAGSPILSYADEQTTPNSQYATVTAQLLDGQSSATVSNVPVVFGAYQNDVLITGSEQTVNTDSNGQASYTYHSAGRGDVVVKAVPDNRTLLTKTFAVEDCTYYNPNSITSTTTLNKDLPSGDWELSFKVKRPSSSGNASYIQLNNDSRIVSLIGQVGSNGANQVRCYTSSSNFSDYAIDNTPQGTEATLKLVKDGTSFTYSMGSSSTTMTCTQTFSKLYSVEASGGNYVKELKVKPL